MKLTRKQIAVIVVALVVVVAVVVTVVLLVGKKSKKSTPIPSGPIPAGNLNVGLYQFVPPPGGTGYPCDGVSKATNLEAASIILNLQDNTSPSLQMNYQYTGGSYKFMAKLAGFYIIHGESDSTLDGLMLLVELPNDAELTALLKSHNITVNPSNLYIVSPQGWQTPLKDQIYTQNFLPPVNLQPVTVDITNGYKICNTTNSEVKNIPVTVQPIQYYENILNRINQSLV